MSSSRISSRSSSTFLTSTPFHFSYLCVENGSRITEDAFYTGLIRRNREVFDCAWGSSDFRQGMITLGREFISPNETFPCADDVLAEGADHSTEVDVAHYAIIQGALPRLSNNVLSQQRWLAEEWSSLLGMGPNAPPEPVRVTRTKARAAKSIDPNELAVQVSGIVVDAVMSRLAEIGLTSEVIQKLSVAAEAQRASTQNKIVTFPIQNAAVPMEVIEIPSSSPTPPSSSLDGPFNPSAWKATHERPTVAIKPGTFQTPPPAPSKASLPFFLFDDDEDDVPSISSEVRLPGQRKRVHGAAELSSQQAEAGPSRPLKRVRREEPSVDADKWLEWDDLDSLEDFVVQDTPTPASQGGREGLTVRHLPSPVFVFDEPTVRGNVRGAIQTLVGNVGAREKNEAQMLGILMVMRSEEDAMVTMRTGGGKSMLWLVPALLDPKAKFIVVCPFTVLLDEQCEKALKAGIKAINYSQSRMVAADVQILFVQVEHVGSVSFSK